MRPFSSVRWQIWWSCGVSPVILSSLVFFPVASKFSALSTSICSLKISLAGEQNSKKNKRKPQKNTVLSCTLTDFGVIHVLAQLRNLHDEELRFLFKLTLVNWKKAARWRHSSSLGPQDCVKHGLTSNVIFGLLHEVADKPLQSDDLKSHGRQLKHWRTTTKKKKCMLENFPSQTSWAAINRCKEDEDWLAVVASLLRSCFSFSSSCFCNAVEGKVRRGRTNQEESAGALRCSAAQIKDGKQATSYITRWLSRFVVQIPDLILQHDDFINWKKTNSEVIYCLIMLVIIWDFMLCFVEFIHLYQMCLSKVSYSVKSPSLEVPGAALSERSAHWFCPAALFAARS